MLAAWRHNIMLPLYSSLCSYFERTKSPYLRNGHGTKRYEIFFRHVFTSTWPHKSADAPDDREFKIPVKQLSHITHDKEMREITSTKEDGFYTMLPSRKVGKAYKWDGTPMGESFFLDCTPLPSVEELRDLSFTYVSNEESLMPEGYYSWWGVKTEGYSGQSKCALPGYLENPPQSTYGTNEISGDLNKLLQNYRDSRAVEGEPNKPDIYLLVGGTLRYSHEICCVVIVCTADDKESAALKGYMPVTTEPDHEPYNPEPYNPNPTLNLNDLTDDTGKVVNLSKKPTFCPKFLSTAADGSWANLAFAFYFTNCDPLKCETSTCTVQEDSIKHPLSESKPGSKSKPGKVLCMKQQKPHVDGVHVKATNYKADRIELKCYCFECPNEIQLPKQPCPNSWTTRYISYDWRIKLVKHCRTALFTHHFALVCGVYNNNITLLYCIHPGFILEMKSWTCHCNYLTCMYCGPPFSWAVMISCGKKFLL